MAQPLALGAYRLATKLASPLARPWLESRRARGKEDGARLGERLGRGAIPRPRGPLLWLHGASVGESLALLPLIGRAVEVRPDATILATSGTLASAEVLAKRLPQGAIHQFVPLDTPNATRSFINHWRPDVGVFVESDVWPNLLLAAKGSNTRLALLSAKMSDASLARWRKIPASARALFGAFDLVLARDEHEGTKFRSLGAPVGGVIDLKFGAAPLPRDEALSEHYRGLWGAKHVLLGASTHAGEDEMILDAFVSARGVRDNTVLVLAPRHPARAEAVAKLAVDRGLAVAGRSLGDAAPRTRVLIADAIGELGTWFGLADLALVGGSWVGGVGGHNPLEPARLGCPVIVGPKFSGWPVYRDLASRGAARIVRAEDLAGAMSQVWTDPDGLTVMASSARVFVEARDGTVSAGLDRVIALLP